MLFFKFSYNFFWPSYKTLKKHIFYSTFFRKITFTADISITQCAPRGGCRLDFCTSCVIAKIRTPFVTFAVFNDSKASLLCACVHVCVRVCEFVFINGFEVVKYCKSDELRGPYLCYDTHAHDVQKSDRQLPCGAHWVMLISAINVIFRKNVL